MSEKERALLPEHPAGLVELADADLNTVAGGAPPIPSRACSYNRECR
ncbi:mersacidin/lichenicidin family type 2 lantibiotic [Chamaesiphon minutus]|nr:mersacidin/lichenicidin family type 2 lantibiotic [Chamaesiphon minutus]